MWSTWSKGIVIVGVILPVAISIDGRKMINTIKNEVDDVKITPDPKISLLSPDSTKLRKFTGGGAVAADVPMCAQTGKSILEKNGSSVDAIIATMLCSGLLAMPHMGLGGGFLMTIYERSTGKAFFLNARDSAPLAADPQMYENMTGSASKKGALSITVPGEIAGYWAAHQRFGKLPWAELFTDAIRICDSGWNLTQTAYNALGASDNRVDHDPILKSMYVNDTTKTYKLPGSLIKPTKLCDTLRTLADKGAAEFYNGSLGRSLIDDLKKHGSILTMEDLMSYKAKLGEPLQSNLSDGSKLYTVGPPGSGSLLVFITNILDRYNFTSESLNGLNNKIETYHRMIETFKYAFAFRTKMGDTDFVDLSELLRKMTSPDYAQSIKEKISDNRTWDDPEHYGAENGFNEDHGTAHFSAISPNGDAVAVTSSINIFFGSGIVSESTGILLNSGMDDFAIPSVTNFFGLPGTNKNNFIHGGKRALSSMVPAIVVGSDGNVRMVLGAAGGTKITTSTASVIARYLWMKTNIKEAIDAPRIHHQLSPMKVDYQNGFEQSVIDGLKQLGHETHQYNDLGSVIVCLVQDNGTIYGTGDYRRNGDVAGIN